MRFLHLAICILAFTQVCKAQDEPAADAPEDGAEGDDAKEEECEEAWEYLEFLKSEIKEKIEVILQETLFEPRALLDQTVAETMTKTLEIRDTVLKRTKDIRTGEGEITICPEQGVNQEQFLSMVRMDIMTVLLSLIEPDAASTEKLQQIGRELLSVRTKVNGEITRIIMLRETGSIPKRSSSDECDCGILKDIVSGLDKVVNDGEEEVIEEGAEEGAEEGGEEAEAPPAEEGEGGEGGEEMDPVQGLTMVLMDIDAKIGTLYNDILSELDEVKRQESSDELSNLKDISTQLNLVISKMIEVSDPDSEDGKRKLQKLVDRDVSKIRNDVDRQLGQCRAKCPSDCESCGSEKIEELKLKLQEYKAIIEDLEEEDAKENIRSDLMQFLTASNEEMTALLTQKAESEDGTLEQCDTEKLEVLEHIKGPLWMMVNVTIFGDEAVLSEMIVALEAALDEMSGKYCSSEPRAVTPVSDDNTCDLDEIDKAREFIADIDTIISDNLFKQDDDEARKNAMLGFIDLKSAMDDRVRQLFNDNLKCHEEVSQLKNVYMDQVTQCLAQMMNPRYRFEDLTRADRVACIKQLRVTIEDRRGELLMREIERRINENKAEDDGENEY